MTGRCSSRWWRGLKKAERRTLVALMTARGTRMGGGGYYPDDCSDCGSCGTPMLGAGLCSACYDTYRTLHDKADALLRGPVRGDPRPEVEVPPSNTD